jgi:hypothetical protein
MVLSIRVPVEIVNFLRNDARERLIALGVHTAEEVEGEEGEKLLNLTAQVNRILESVRTYFALPYVAVNRLEEDRKALGLGRLEYIQMLLFLRSEQVGQKGAAFDRDELQAKVRPKPTGKR